MSVVKTAKRTATSKTVWFGLALAVFGFLQTQHGPLDGIMSAEMAGWFDMLVGVIVVALRFMSTGGLIVSSDENSEG